MSFTIIFNYHDISFKDADQRYSKYSAWEYDSMLVTEYPNYIKSARYIKSSNYIKIEFHSQEHYTLFLILQS